MDMKDALRQNLRDYYKQQLSMLVEAARRDGIVLTAETTPTRPLRVGGYEVFVSVRDSRVTGHCDPHVTEY